MTETPPTGPIDGLEPSTTAASDDLPTRTGRVDPHRRERIARAAIEVVATHGVEGLTHRRVAAAAGVPLGSTTYHYATLDDLLAAGLEAAAAESAAELRAWAETISERDLVVASIELVLGRSEWHRERSRIRYELYLAALRRPRLRPISTEWSRQLAGIYCRYIDDLTAEALAAAVDGLWISALVREDRLAPEAVERVLRRIVSPEQGGEGRTGD